MSTIPFAFAASTRSTQLRSTPFNIAPIFLEFSVHTKSHDRFCAHKINKQRVFRHFKDTQNLKLDFIVHTKSKNRVFTSANGPAGKPIYRLISLGRHGGGLRK